MRYFALIITVYALIVTAALHTVIMTDCYKWYELEQDKENPSKLHACNYKQYPNI